MQNAAFRQEVLQHLTALRARWPDGNLHLLYVPGTEDPSVAGRTCTRAGNRPGLASS